MLIKKTSLSNKYNVFFFMKDAPAPLEIKCSFQNDISVKQAIFQTINIFNEELKRKSYCITLSDNLQYWELKFSKKNGTPKTDYPCTNKIKFILFDCLGF